MKDKKIRKYIKHFCLLFVGIFTCFITTLSVSAATRGFAFRAFRLDGAIRWRTYVASTNLTINGGKFISLSDGIIAFCIEPGLEALLIEDGVYDINTNTSSFSSITGYSPDTLNDLELISFFGYGFNGDTSDEMYMATQLEIWERVSPNTVAQSYGDFSAITTKRNQIKERVNKAKIKPSFDMTTKDIALNEEVSFTDNNGVLKDFVVSSCTNCTARIDGNTLKVVSTSIGKAKVSLSRKFSNSDVGSILYTKGTHQKLMTFSHPAISISNLNLNTYGGKIKITKVDSETNTTTPQGQASLVGATYNVYDSNNNVVSSLTIGSDKNATTDYLPLGTYTIKEVASSTGYYVDGTTYKAEITNSNIVNITVKETVIKGKIKINKYDSETNSCKAQGQATLVGAKYGIFDYNNNLVDTLTIDSNCSATSKSLPYGNYTIKELESSNGYYIDGTTYKANITNSNTITITSKEDIIKGQIKINKIDSETNSCKAQGQATLVGAKYGIFDYNNNLVDTLIIDNNCSATSNLLPFGSYTIKELNAPTGYEIDTNIYSANIINSNIINITSKENVIKGKIKITKVDSETNTTTPQGEATLIGAKYGVYDYNNNLVDTLIIGNDSTAISKLLPYGNYTIKELENSKGYYLNTEIYSEFIEQAIDYSLTVKEDVIKNDFEFYKFYGNVDTGFIYAEPNATFNVLNNNDEIVLTFTTDKNGYAKITLPYGNYKLYQIKGLDDYKLMFPFSIRVNEDTSLNQVNYLKNGSITAKLKLIKIDSETNLPIKLAGVKFKIRNKETNEFICQTTNKVICEFETDENGVMITPLPLFGGDYIIEEIKAPNGYLLSNKSVEFSIKENTEIIEDSIYGSLIEVEFENKAVKGKIEINKTGEKVVIENGSFKYETINLENVIFEVRASEDIIINDYKYYSKDELVGTLTTDSNGYASIDKLPLGKYYIKEISSSNGNILDTNIYEVELTYKNEFTEVVSISKDIKNYLPKGKLEFTKTDLTTGKVIPDTLIEIYTENNELIFSGKTDSNGKIEITNLPVNRYYIIEKEAATGYLISSEKVFFQIKSNNEIVKANMTNEKIKGTLEFVKIDSETGDPIANTEIKIYNADTDELVFTGITDIDGKITVDLEYSKYYLVESKSSQGYILDNNKVFFSVQENSEVIEITMTNDKIKMPETFNTDLTSKIVIISTALFGVGILIYEKKKNK